MKRILLFGAGKSATVLIDYLKNLVRAESGHLTVVDANLHLVQQKLQDAAGTTAASFDITNALERKQQIERADLVISLLPPALHILVARECISARKNLLTASYVDGDLKKLQPQIEAAGVLFLCEMGLDPGIDHMSAKALIDAIQENGGKITTFLSHCGGLVAPESDDNPWHYKISWNPRNVVLAGKGGAIYRWNGVEKRLEYRELFSEQRYAHIPGLAPLCWYPNRDSLPYRALYGLQYCNTFVRTTLRHPQFIAGWKNIIALHLTDETDAYNAGGKSLKELFEDHLKKHGLTHLLKSKLNEANRTPNTNQFVQQLAYLGFYDDQTKLDRERCSAADLFQYALEKKLVLGEHDKDMVVMQHEIEYEQTGTVHKHTSTLVVKGDDSTQTAMAKTVGLPLGIAAKLILNGAITCNGLHIPVLKEIYEPVLSELKKHGILFFEEKQEMK